MVEVTTPGSKLGKPQTPIQHVRDLRVGETCWWSGSCFHRIPPQKVEILHIFKDHILQIRTSKGQSHETRPFRLFKTPREALNHAREQIETSRRELELWYKVMHDTLAFDPDLESEGQQ